MIHCHYVEAILGSPTLRGSIMEVPTHLPE